MILWPPRPSQIMFLQTPSHLLGCIPSSYKYHGRGDAFDLHRALSAHCDWSPENIYKAKGLMAPRQVSLGSNMVCWLCKSPCVAPRMDKNHALHQRHFLRLQIMRVRWSTGCDGSTEHKQICVFMYFTCTHDVSGPTRRPLHSCAHYFRRTRSHAHTYAAIPIVPAAFGWGWQLEVHPKPSGHVHSNAGFSATLKAQRTRYSAIPWRLCRDGCD